MGFELCTFVDAMSATEIEASIAEAAVWVSAPTFEALTGWSLKPEGFCCGDVCVPAGRVVADDGSVNLSAFAVLTNRPLVVDQAECAVCLGAASADRSQELSSLQAPDFALPDLEGKMHRLSDYRGRKVLLAAYASW